MSAKKPQKQRTTASVKPPAVAHPIPEATLDKRLFYVLISIAGILFMNTLTHGFVLDDIAVIEQNRFVQEGFSGIPKIMTTFYWEGYWNSNAGLYRPLSLISFAIEWGISPNNPFIHHFFNVAFYALSIGLLYKLLQRMFPAFSPWIPFGITLLFAVHPIHTEVVANIKSRDEILCFLFFVLTFNYILKHGLSTAKHFLIAGILFLLCLLSKEAGILFLPIMGTYFLLFRKTGWLKTLRLFIPLIAVAVVWLAWHQYIIRSSEFERITYTYLDNSVVGCTSTASQLATGLSILGHYAGKSVAPVNLSYDYSYNQIPCASFGSPMTLFAILLLVACGYFIYRNGKKYPEIAFGLLFFLISISLVTNIFTLIGATMGDRLLYTPVLGICIVVVTGLYSLLKQTAIRTYAHGALYGVLFVGLLFSVASFKRNRDWASNETLFTADVEHAPNSARVHFNYGTILMAQLPENPEDQRPFLPEVISHFERALQIDSMDLGSHTNLGVCYYRTGEYAKSIEHTRKALISNPKDTAILANLADAYFKNNQPDSAIRYYELVVKSSGATARHYNYMGTAFFNQKAYEKAIASFRKGLERFGKDNQELLMNLGNAYGASGNFTEARNTFLHLTELNPNNKQALQMLAMSYQSLGDIPNAQKYADLANGKKP